ncbi:MAG TPA: hypothetical protein VIF09_10665, partial [Polyangiaceae bacterium]
EDVSQDGHLVIEAMPHATGAVWRQLSQQRPVTFGPGVVPILSRIVVEGGEGPISVGATAEGEGFYHLAHTVHDGAPDRLILAMWAQVLAPIGRTHPPQPPDAGRSVVAGRVFAEHVFTRPFAPQAERRVRSLDLGDGQPFVPEARYTFREPEASQALPDGATALDEAPVPDEAPTVFGADHTDSNQHVNSLVYPRLFIEAALRRFHALGLPGPPPLARAMELAFRKPCFAGERARVTARAFQWGDRRGITAGISVDGDPPGARPRCAARILFDR